MDSVYNINLKGWEIVRGSETTSKAYSPTLLKGLHFDFFKYAFKLKETQSETDSVLTLPMYNPYYQPWSEIYKWCSSTVFRDVPLEGEHSGYLHSGLSEVRIRRARSSRTNASG